MTQEPKERHQTKRKRALTISELPTEALASIASYLPKTVVGFWAAAIPDDGTKAAILNAAIAPTSVTFMN
jgi:hypothetical protein